eukprot:Nk52_evm2s207 gene=Nk52_evmTU2s207
MILYGLIAYKTIPLVDYTEASGNFAQIAEEILQKIPTSTETRMTYVYDAYNFHYVWEKNTNLVYLCMCEADFGRRLPFAFLVDLQERFGEYAGGVCGGGGGGYEPVMYGYTQVFQGILAERMEYYSTDEAADKIDQVRSQIDGIRDVMIKNIEKVLERDEKIEVLRSRTDELENSAVRFRRTTKRVHDQIWWKRMKLRIILGIIAGIVIAVVGYLIFKKYIKK